MSGTSKLDPQEFDLIRDHIVICIGHATTAVERLRAAGVRLESDLTGPQLRYWEHVQSGLRWAIDQAKHRHIDGYDAE